MSRDYRPKGLQATLRRELQTRWWFTHHRGGRASLRLATAASRGSRAGATRHLYGLGSIPNLCVYLSRVRPDDVRLRNTIMAQDKNKCIKLFFICVQAATATSYSLVLCAAVCVQVCQFRPRRLRALRSSRRRSCLVTSLA